MPTRRPIDPARKNASGRQSASGRQNASGQGGGGNRKRGGSRGKHRGGRSGASAPDDLGGSTIEVDGTIVDLRNRSLAALLAWLIPGGGHAYQGRHAKALAYFVCILSTWFFGLAIGGSRVVYASWQPGDHRWHFPLQAGAGLVAMPAVVQNRIMAAHTFDGRTSSDYDPPLGGFMAPPYRPVLEREADQISAWYAVRGAGYEMGTWYTVIAGLLNLLVVYDAYGGPLSTPISGRRESDTPDDPDDTGGEDHADGGDRLKEALVAEAADASGTSSSGPPKRGDKADVARGGNA